MRRATRNRLVALAAAAALVLAACSSDDGESAGGSSTTAPAERGAGSYQATIRRTSHGIPHIVADDLASLAFGQGYASAEDHLCTLADQVVKIRSERSLYHGAGENDANLNSDLAWLHLGLRERAERDLEDESPEARQLFTGFTAGWNRYLEETGADNVTGWCAGEPWVQPITELDLYTYARSISLFASGGQLLDFIATAQPPGSDAANADEDTTTTEAAWAGLAPEQMGSNGWAIGADRTEDGTGMLVANPHFPWEGELRFWESHLTIPGETDVYGAQLLGLPGIGIGFNEHVAWTHTVSAGSRFTAYTLDLVAGEPTSYQYDEEVREMTPTEHTVEVLAEDGSTETVTRTLWSSHYGPIINFPGLGWTEDLTITYRDANIDNTGFVSQYLGMDRATSLEDFISVHEDSTGVPLFNTIAVDDEGTAWYGDTSATPNLSDEAIDAWLEERETDPFVQVAWDSGAVLLDGSDSTFEWVEAEGARSPGLVPFSDMPQITRSDYVFNANDSFWLANASELLEGDYSALHGEQGTPRSPRTRENAYVLDATDGSTPAGEGGLFTLEELQEAILLNQGHTARRLRDAVVERCTGVTEVQVEPLMGEAGEEELPGGTVPISEACESLASWDGLLSLDSVGAVLWRELLAQFPPEAFTDAGELWAEPFDPADPVGTPSGLASAPATGPDPVLVNLARAVQVIEAAGWALDDPLGEVQYAPRGDLRVPIHGGGFREGVTNIVGYPSFGTSLEETFEAAATVTSSSDLRADGYPVTNGTSFLMTLEFTADGPVAFAFLDYGESGDPTSDEWSAQTERFSGKDWREVLFTEDAIEDDPAFEEYTVTG